MMSGKLMEEHLPAHSPFIAVVSSYATFQWHQPLPVPCLHHPVQRTSCLSGTVTGRWCSISSFSMTWKTPVGIVIVTGSSWNSRGRESFVNRHSQSVGNRTLSLWRPRASTHADRAPTLPTGRTTWNVTWPRCIIARIVQCWRDRVVTMTTAKRFGKCQTTRTIYKKSASH